MSARVLVVDNDSSVSALYVELLGREGFDATSVSPPEKAAAQDDQPSGQVRSGSRRPGASAEQAVRLR